MKIYLVVSTDRWEEDFQPIEARTTKDAAERRAKELTDAQPERVSREDFFYIAHELELIQDGPA